MRLWYIELIALALLGLMLATSRVWAEELPSKIQGRWCAVEYDGDEPQVLIRFNEIDNSKWKECDLPAIITVFRDTIDTGHIGLCTKLEDIQRMDMDTYSARAVDICGNDFPDEEKVYHLFEGRLHIYSMEQWKHDNG